ncbi:MAG: DUF4091 domain-containing protein [Verrucomicrobia bacterium]|nr:DUF4091 domain-containing protein [Verrucomicrobiota bacterium]
MNRLAWPRVRAAFPPAAAARLALAWVGVWGLGSDARAAWHVWTVTETRHVCRSEPPGTNRTVSLAAARNEWESFQVLLRADEPVAGIRLQVTPLRGPGGALIGSRDFRLYRQRQLKLSVGTYRNERFKPDYYPDPLIPFAHPLTGHPLRSGRFRAEPFDLPANQTRGFWVDVHVPEDAPPGRYEGRCRVSAADGRRADLPVALEVWPFALPRTPAMKTAFGSPAARLRAYYRERARRGLEPEPTNWAGIDAQCAALAAAHRVNAAPPADWLRPKAMPDGSYRIPAARVRALREFVDRFHVNALAVPHPAGVIRDPDRERAKLHAWLRAFDRAARELARPQTVFYVYLKDEPNDAEAYRYVRRWGRAIREARSAVKVLVVEQTWTAPGMGGADSAWGDLYGAVDIWCPLFSLFRPESAAARRALGERIWTYTALCQGKPTPWWHIDYPLLNYRVPAWIAWRHHITGLLYWGGMSYWKQVKDPWTEAPHYTPGGRETPGRKAIRFNGEGSLVYPARAVGYEGVAPAIRLKALRDGIEDYDYLATVDRMGLRAEAERIVRPLADSFFKWEKDPSAYRTARRQLARLIAAHMRRASEK